MKVKMKPLLPPPCTPPPGGGGGGRWHFVRKILERGSSIALRWCYRADTRRYVIAWCKNLPSELHTTRAQAHPHSHPPRPICPPRHPADPTSSRPPSHAPTHPPSGCVLLLRFLGDLTTAPHGVCVYKHSHTQTPAPPSPTRAPP